MLSWAVNNSIHRTMVNKETMAIITLRFEQALNTVLSKKFETTLPDRA